MQRLQGIVARELPAADAAVVTVGALHAGTVSNVIPDEAELLVSVRTFDQAGGDKVLHAIERIVTAEAAASGASAAPEITSLGAFPVVVNDAAACARVTDAFAAGIGPGLVLDPGPVTGSEDVGLLATAAGRPAPTGCSAAPTRPCSAGSRRLTRPARSSRACRPTTRRCSRR